MSWYSILPSHLSGVETWVFRICIVLAFINFSPWLLAIGFDIVYYLCRQIWHEVPVYGGRARGETRPRAPSLADKKRRRTLSLTGMITTAGNPSQVREEHKELRKRLHARTLSEESIAEEDEDYEEDKTG